ncbi:TM2 domain-containing protein [Sporocytophaga myxococcoides]|uniref:TM2 domain-containing protein n=1 Tax=Sporocytophaga myxococcoides TaxID=153721 RepID=UPI0003F8B81E|nr:TM2 domain-containing protein [Sporocytophaga myxococcoides]
MDQNKVDLFIASMNEKFPAEKLGLIREQLSRLDDSKLAAIQSIQYKNPTTILIVSILIGGLGIDRFMLGQTGLGVAKLLTCGGMGIWWLIDLFLVMGKAREVNYNKLSQVAV